ncbi:MAG: hypothetical protein ACI4SG_03765 [Oligosphaeraceae bacterium]
MDFIIRHYEKLILVSCLLLLLFSQRFVSNSQEETQRETREAKEHAKTAIKCDSLLEELGSENFEELDEILNAPQTKVELTKSPNGGDAVGLLEGGKVIICKNPKCGYILPYSVDVCPECKTEQEKIGPEMPPEHDLDQDGIPDVFEKETTFLHYRYRFDAMLDQDQDGFLNLEEYRAGTDMEDPESVPPLAYLLRVESAAPDSLPVVLARVKKAGSDNPADWSAVFSGAARGYRLGNAVPDMDGFKVTAIQEDSVTISSDTETYTLKVNETVAKKSGFSIRLRYLGNHVFGFRALSWNLEQLQNYAKSIEEASSKGRNPQMGGRQAPARGGMGQGAAMGMGGAGQQGGTGMTDPQISFSVQPGDIFPLVKQRGNGPGSMGGGMGGMGMTSTSAFSFEEETGPIVEYYQVQELSTNAEGAPVISVVQVSELGVPVNGTVIPLVELDKTPYNPYSAPSEAPNHDFLPPSMNNAAGGMGMNGAGF